MILPNNSRISKEDTYLNTAEVFAYRSTCLKRKYGAAIVKDDIIISTGYNGSPRGQINCCELEECPRIKANCHQGEGYSMCKAIHAEMNALIFAKQSLKNAKVYCTHISCENCMKTNGISDIIFFHRRHALINVN